MPSGPSTDRRFLDEAVLRGVLDEAQAAACDRILDTLAEIELPLSAGDVAIRKGFLTKEQVDEVRRALARRRVGRYEVLDRLGRGGTGVVWRARDVRLGRVVALKLLARPRVPDDLLTSYHARFQREARTAVTLNHVNIVRGLDYGDADGYVYFAMEFVSGESAAERLQRVGRLPEPEGLRVAVQVVEALLYVREFGLVHRDLKPENLLLTPTGDVKVCDLGLATPTLEEASRMGADGRIAGTPLYMAPEQVRDPDSVDWRTDVYGLGATLYHLLTGRPPFLPGTAGGVIQRHLEEAPADPREHVLELSAGVSAVVLKMLAKSPSDRYASLEDLASDLGAMLDGRPPSHALRVRSGQEGAVAGVLAEAQGVRSRFRTPRRRRRLVAVAVIGLVTVAAVAGETWYSDHREPLSDARDRPQGEHAVGEVTERPPAPVHPSDTSVPPVDQGRSVYAEAQRLELRGAPLDEVIGAFEFVAEHHPTRPSGERAAKHAAELRARLDASALSELTRRRRAAEDALERGDVVAAVDELVAFPPLYHGTEAFKAAMKDAQRIMSEGRATAERALEDARVAAVERRFEDAARLLETAQRTRLPGLAISQVELEITLEQASRDAEREERRERWQLTAGRALVSSIDEPAVATRLLDAELESGALGTYAREIEALRRWLPLAHRARVRLEEVWEEWAAEGRRLEFRTTGGVARDLVGAPVAVRDGRLLLAAPGDAAVAVTAAELPIEILTAAISPGGSSSTGGMDEMAAFLLATRRLEDAARFQAPPDLIDVVRVATIAEASACLDRAAVLISEGELVAGRAAVDAVISFAPWYAAAHTARGRLLADLGSLDAAESSFRAALDAAVPDSLARVALAALLERRARFADAEGHLRLFLDETADATDDDLVALRERVEEDVDRVSERRVQAVLGPLRRDARNALRAGRKGEAAGLFARILAARPDDAEALLESGRLHRDAGRIFDAFRAWMRLTTALPEDRRAHDAERELAGLERFRSGVTAGRDALREGRTALREARLDDAIAAYRRAILMSPFLVDAHQALAEALLARGEANEVRDDLAAAVAAADDVLLLDATLAAATLTRAHARYLLGDLEAAVRDAEQAAERLNDPSGALLLAGRALLDQGLLDEAAARFEDAFEARAYPDPLYWHAETLKRQGRRRAAWMKLELLYDRWGAPEHLELACARLHKELRD